MTKASKDPIQDHSSAYGDELTPGTQLCYGQYVVEKYLNSGGFGVTYLARDSLGRQVVIKECYPNAMCCRAGDMVRLRSESYVSDFKCVVELFEKEARALAHLQHPNVVGVHQIFKDNGTAYMALDYVEGLDLLDVHEKTPEVLTAERLVALLKSLLKALTYVHENGILHRDISPDNILLDHTKTPVLIDFGAAREGATRASRILSRVHTVKDGYSPQEFYVAGSNQSPSSDLYALAATFYHLMTGAPPTNSNLRLAAVAENRPDPFVPLMGRCPDFEPAFLTSIDTCLNLFSKDRLESASVWSDAIEGGFAGTPGAKAQDEKEIEDVIAKLVTEHRKVMAERQNRKEEPTVQRAPVPEVEDPKRAAEREYWAILNEDPSEWRKDLVATEDPAAEPEPVVVKPRIVTPQPKPQEPEFDLSKLNLDRTVSASRRRFSLSSWLSWSERGKPETEETKATNLG